MMAVIEEPAFLLPSEFPFSTDMDERSREQSQREVCEWGGGGPNCESLVWRDPGVNRRCDNDFGLY